MNENIHETKHMSAERRLDTHENHISQMSESINELKQMMEKNNESQIALSDAVIRMAAQLEMLTNLTRQSEENSQRLYNEEKSTALMNQKLEQIPILEDKINTKFTSLEERMQGLKESQTYNKVIIGIIVFVSGLVASGITAAVIRLLFNL